MAQKPPAPSLSLKDLRARRDRAVREGRFQTALDLAKQLAKAEPSPEDRQALLDAYLGRGRQLMGEGRWRDAATVLEVGAQLARDDPAALTRFAAELARAGDAARAFQLAEWLPDPEIKTRLAALALDGALQRGGEGRAALPEALRADYDRVRTAFDHAAAGRDEEARQTLQGISLASPALEWKLLLRGFIAYYLNEDERALENWSRLDPARFPARLAAPFRADIDPAYLESQPPAVQNALRQRTRTAEETPLLRGLRALQKAAVGNPEEMMPVFRAAERIVPLLRQDRPDLLARLARCVYWDVVQRGQPHDRQRYARLFGAPPDDPDFHRLNAMVLFETQVPQESNEEWLAFERQIDRLGGLSDDDRRRLRAMVFMRMAQNAAPGDLLQRVTPDELPAGRMLPEYRAQFRPNALECYRRAIAADPDWIEPHLGQLSVHIVRGDRKQLFAAAEAVIARFPEHLDTLTNLAIEYETDGNIARCIELRTRLVALSPLEQQFRIDLVRVQRRLGIQRLLARKPEEARAAFEAALEVNVATMQPVNYACMALTAFAAGRRDEAEQWLARAIAADAFDRVLVEGWMFAVAARLKLPKPFRTRFEQPFKDLLAHDRPSAAQAQGLVTLFSLLRAEKLEYHGAKSHWSKVLKLLERVDAATYTESLIESIGMTLVAFEEHNVLGRLGRQWRRQFPTSPFPPVFLMEWSLARGNAADAMRHGNVARDLAAGLPPGPHREKVLAMIEQRMREAEQRLNPLRQLRMLLGAMDEEEESAW